MTNQRQTRDRWATPSFWRSLMHAFAGLRAAARTERNLRIHALATLCVVLCAAWVDVSLTRWAILVLTIGLVICAELVNSAIERLVDLVQPEYHPLAGEVKDVAAAAVVVTAMTAVVVAGVILLPALVEKIAG
ncbi:MAG: hypothetical protein RLY87_353 [Chloroflexota bacterium]